MIFIFGVLVKLKNFIKKTNNLLKINNDYNFSKS